MTSTYPLPIVAWQWCRTFRARRRKVAALERATTTIRRELQLAQELGLTAIATVYNVALFLMIFERDFLLLRDDVLFARSSWRRQWALRIMVLNIYEATEDIGQLLGKSFRSTLHEFPLTEEDWNAFNALRSGFAQLKRRNRPVLKELRNAVAAHREHDADKTLALVEGLEFDDVVDMAGELYDQIRPTYDFLVRVGYLWCHPSVQLKHALAALAARSASTSPSDPAKG